MEGACCVRSEIGLEATKHCMINNLEVLLGGGCGHQLFVWGRFFPLSLELCFHPQKVYKVFGIFIPAGRV